MKKIIIIGPGGSGKTTLAKQLSAKLNLPVYHLDQYFWKPDWKEGNHIEFMDAQYDIVDTDNWIIDGTYLHTLSIRLMQADTVIRLDVPRVHCVLRVIKRQLFNYGKCTPGMPEGCFAYFNGNFFRFVKYIWQFNKRSKPYFDVYLSEPRPSFKLYHLKSVKEINILFKQIPSP